MDLTYFLDLELDISIIYVGSLGLPDLGVRSAVCIRDHMPFPSCNPIWPITHHDIPLLHYKKYRN